VFVTTNFDRLLEHALQSRGIEPVVVTCDADLQTAPSREHSTCYVLKPHGDYLQQTVRNKAFGLESDVFSAIRARSAAVRLYPAVVRQATIARPIAVGAVPVPDDPRAGRPEAALAEHFSIVAAVKANDPDAAETAMRAHLTHIRAALLSDHAAGTGGRPALASV
jgi:hypothetical protein